MSRSNSRANLLEAERSIEAAIHGTSSADHPRALAKMHTALDQTRKAYVLLTEGESVSVGDPDDRRVS